MIDTHAHLQDEKYENIQQIVDNAQKNGVNTIICASADIKTSCEAVTIANKYDNIFATIGVHPEDAGKWNEDSKQKLIELAKNKKVVAIGEIGLDYHYEFYTRDEQKKAFVEQIYLAYQLGLPVVIHTRDASGDTMQIVRDNLKLLTNGVCIHCYSMSLEILKEIIGYGFVISLGGAVTFKNARGLLDIARECPLENLMLETDSPYMSPEPYRGKRNEPQNVLYVAQKIAELKNISVGDVIKQTTLTAQKFFKI